MEFINPKNNKKPKFFTEPAKENELFKDEEWRDLYEDNLKEKAKREEKARKIDELQSQKQEVNKPDKKIEVSIKMSLPKMDKESWRTRLNNFKVWVQEKFILYRKEIIILASVILVIGLLSTVVYFVKNHDKKSQNEPQKVNQSQSTVGSKPADHDPEFEMLQPQGRTIKKENVYYDKEKNFAKYDDEISGAKITVSQQPLPDSFKEDVGKELERVSKNFGATEKLSVDNGSYAYYGQSASGPQTIIYVKNDVLMFIRTQREIDKASILVYLNNLD